MPVSVRPEASAEKSHTVAGFYDAFSLTLLANLTGNPSISIPGPVNGNDCRPSVQLIGQRFDDANLITVAEHMSKIFTGAM
jgi:aspartyl-tRNA(Asn)/glutamyl-tRNA(Gln) amidotransferase subunit A